MVLVLLLVSVSRPCSFVVLIALVVSVELVVCVYYYFVYKSVSFTKLQTLQRVGTASVFVTVRTL